MKRFFVPVILLLIIFNSFVIPAIAKTSDIDLSNLPDAKELQKIQATITSLEPMVTYWTNKWDYKTPKDKVVKQITESYQKIDAFAKQYPNNMELILFRGLTAYYAYQLDLPEYKDLALADFSKAALIDPTDIRPKWFAGVHLVKMGKMKDGMTKLLEVYRSKPANQLSESFWEDFAYCALLAGMPSHALMGLENANALEGKQSDVDRLIGTIVHNKLKEPPIELQMVSKNEIWEYADSPNSTTLTNRLFGFSLQAPLDWRVNLVDCQNGTSAIMLKPPAKTGFGGSVSSTIMVMAQKPKNNETFDSFVKSMLNPKLTIQEVEKTLSFGKVKAFEGETLTSYTNEGGAHCEMIMFSRNLPAKPGLILETPRDIPTQQGSSGTQYYRSEAVYKRIAGPIYYLILLDTTQSTFIQSEIELEQLLNTLVVE